MIHKKRISVGIIEKNHVFREHLVNIIVSHKDMVVAFSIAAPENYETSADIVLLRVEISVDFMNQTQAENHSKILAIDAEPNHGGFSERLQNGVRGFVLSSSNESAIIDAIRIIAAGGLVIPNPILSIICSESAHESKQYAPPNFALTNRELQIALLASGNLTNKEIAVELNIGIGTAKAHIHQILKKLGLQKRAHLANCLRKHQAAHPIPVNQP